MIQYSVSILREVYLYLINENLQSRLFCSEYEWEKFYKFPHKDISGLKHLYFSHRLALLALLRCRKEKKSKFYESITDDKFIYLGEDTFLQGNPICLNLMQQDASRVDSIAVAITSWLTYDSFRWKDQAIPEDLNYGLVCSYSKAIVFYAMMILGYNENLKVDREEYQQTVSNAQEFYKHEYSLFTDNEIRKILNAAEVKTQRVQLQLAS
jgi:hypothetical protein